MKDNKSNAALVEIKNSTTIKNILLFLFVILSSCKTEKKTNTIQCNAIDIAIKNATNYLTKSIQDNGMFEYRTNMNSSIKLKSKYNILRHAGTIYSLVMSYKINPNDNLKNIIKNSSQYIIDQSLKSIKETDSIKAIWSRPEVNGSNNPLQAKLGGSGLGLVALISAKEVEPELISTTELEAIGRFITHMQKENGSFCSKYIPSQGGCQDNWTSLYYPGEAALGLVMLYEKSSKKEWLSSAYKTLEYLALTRKNSNNIPADHWALLATDKLLSIENKHNIKISKELLINHAIQISESILKEQVNDHSFVKYNGGFSSDGRITPTATRLEGLQAALNFISKEHKVWNRINSSITPGISFLLQSQVKEGKYTGAFPRAVSEISKGNKKFNSRSTEIRIDYIQHAMSALIQYKSSSKCVN